MAEEEKTWTDMIGREHPAACGFVAICPSCGAVMHTQNLLGELKFNEQGWGVWSENHASTCSLRQARDAEWRRVADRDVYNVICRLADRLDDPDHLRDVVEDFTKKKVGFAELKAAFDL